MNKTQSPTKNLILNITADLYKCLIKNEKLRIEYQFLSVHPHVPVTRCYNCMGFNHIAKNCLMPVEINARCFTCTGEHETDKCPVKDNPEEHKCLNCNRNGRFRNRTDKGHSTMSSSCPIYQETYRNNQAKISTYLNNGPD